MALNFNNFNPKKILYNGLNVAKLVYNSVVVWLQAVLTTISGIPPLTLLNAFHSDDDEEKEKYNNLVDYKIYGNSVQYSNIFDKNTMSKGYLPLSGEYPISSSGFPDAVYTVMNIKAGQVLDISYAGEKEDLGRLRCIDNDTNQVVFNIGTFDNSYYTSTGDFNTSFVDATITAKKDFKLGVLFLNELHDEFYLQIKTSIPSKDYPIEVEVVGDKTKNLFDNSNLLINSHYGTSGNLGTYDGRIATDKINVSNIDTITIKYSRNQTANTAFLSWDEDGNMLERSISKINNKNISGTIDVTDCYEIAFFWWYSETLSEGDICDVMICEGSEVLDYEPFGYKIPIKLSTKNILDYITNFTTSTNGLTNKINNDGSITVTGIVTANYTKIVPITDITDKLEDGETYTISKTNKQSKVYLEVRAKNIETDEITYYSVASTSKSFTVDKTTYVYDVSILTCLVSQWGDENLTITDTFQIEKGSTVTDFEPYSEPKTINIYLDEPLRKVGDYVDYIDFKNQKVVRAIENIQLNGSETISLYTYNSMLGVSFNNVLQSKENRAIGMSNYSNLVGSKYTSNSLWIGVNTLNIYWIGILDELGFTTIDEFANWLANSKPLNINYVLSTAIEETIELPTITTNEGTNILEIDTSISPSNMEVQYYAKGV